MSPRVLSRMTVWRLGGRGEIERPVGGMGKGAQCGLEVGSNNSSGTTETLSPLPGLDLPSWVHIDLHHEIAGLGSSRPILAQESYAEEISGTAPSSKYSACYDGAAASVGEGRDRIGTEVVMVKVGLCFGALLWGTKKK